MMIRPTYLQHHFTRAAWQTPWPGFLAPSTTGTTGLAARHRSGNGTRLRRCLGCIRLQAQEKSIKPHVLVYRREPRGWSHRAAFSASSQDIKEH